MHRASFGHFKLPALRTRKLSSLWVVFSSPRRESAGAAACVAGGMVGGTALVLVLPGDRGSRHQPNPSPQHSGGTPNHTWPRTRRIFTALGSLRCCRDLGFNLRPSRCERLGASCEPLNEKIANKTL